MQAKFADCKGCIQTWQHFIIHIFFSVHMCLCHLAPHCQKLHQCCQSATQVCKWFNRDCAAHTSHPLHADGPLHSCEQDDRTRVVSRVPSLQNWASGSQAAIADSAAADSSAVAESAFAGSAVADSSGADERYGTPLLWYTYTAHSRDSQAARLCRSDQTLVWLPFAGTLLSLAHVYRVTFLLYHSVAR